MKPKAPSSNGAVVVPAEHAPSGLPPALSAPPGVAALWHALTRRWLTILVVGGGLGVLGAVVGWFAAPGKYTGVATLHLDPHPPRGVYESPEDFANFRANMATQIKSDPVLEAALKKPEAAELPEVRAQGGDALTWLRSAVAVDDKTPGPEALRLTVSADRAEDAAVLTNLWAQAAGDVYNADEEAKVKERIKQLRQNNRERTEQLRKRKAELQARRDVLGLEDPRVLDAKMQAEQGALAGLQTQHVTVELELKKLEVKIADLRAGLATPEKVVVAPSAVDEEIDRDFKDNPVVKAQVEQLLGLQKKMGERMALLRPDDRDNDTGVLQYKTGIEEIQKKLAAEREAMRPDYEKRVRART
ncbi:MAG TPA: hypothetical protein VMS17_22230, partial [Gemmataceae bacterium]|nr:hypothetical protein [Gemmataceae bacterium]